MVGAVILVLVVLALVGILTHANSDEPDRRKRDKSWGFGSDGGDSGSSSDGGGWADGGGGGGHHGCGGGHSGCGGGSSCGGGGCGGSS